MVTLVEQGILILAGTCDGASSIDGQGFNKMDAGFGHSLAQQIRGGRTLSEKQQAAAKKLCIKYGGQLAGYLDMAALKSEEVKAAPKANVLVRVFVARRTAKALGVKDIGGTEIIWLPLSHVHSTTDLGDDVFLVEISPWLVEQNPRLRNSIEV